MAKKNYLKMFQDGGPMPGEGMGAPAGAQAGGEGGGPEEMLAAVVESQDPNMALEFCNMLAEQMGLSGGGGAPAPGAEMAPPPMGRYGIKVPVIQL